MFGHRPDGKRLKNEDPVVRITPYLMPMRCDAQVFLQHELDYEKLAAHIPAQIRYQPIPALPDVSRDLSLVAAEEVSCGAVEDEIRKACPQVSAVELFDIYRGIQVGPGRKSMSFKVSFRQDEKALDQETEERYVKKILGNLKYRLGVEIRA